MFALIAGILFIISAVVYGWHEGTANWLFWALFAFAAWAWHFVLDPAIDRRRGKPTV